MIISATKFYSLLCISFAIKTYDCGQDFRFYRKTKHKAADNVLDMIGAMFAVGIQDYMQKTPVNLNKKRSEM